MTNLHVNAVAALGALSDPTRRAIFERIAARPRPVVELASGLPVSRSAVSQHLGVLRATGLVTETAVGSRRIYRLDPRGIGMMREWLEQHWIVAMEGFQGFADAIAEQEENAQKEAGK